MRSIIIAALLATSLTACGQREAENEVADAHYAAEDAHRLGKCELAALSVSGQAVTYGVRGDHDFGGNGVFFTNNCRDMKERSEPNICRQQRYRIAEHVGELPQDQWFREELERDIDKYKKECPQASR